MWTTDTLEWIDIELTSFCNIKCKGCFRVLSDYADDILNKTYLDLDTIKERFQKEMFPNIKIINFCGSVDEPCSHPQFHEIIKHFADWNCHINIATNGSLRTTKWWTELADILPSNHKVVWGIDGSDELSEVYREGSSFKKVQQNFKAFIAAGGQSVWQFISFEHNEHQLETAKQMAKDEGYGGMVSPETKARVDAKVPAPKQDPKTAKLQKKIDGMKKKKTNEAVCSECNKPRFVALPESIRQQYESVNEAKQKGVDGKVCWKGYKRMGTKKKGGKTVDNCVKM